MDIEEGSGNIYADLGLPDATEMLQKGHLVMLLGTLIKQRQISNVQTASILGITHLELESILRGHFHETSRAQLLGFLDVLDPEQTISRDQANF